MFISVTGTTRRIPRYRQSASPPLQWGPLPQWTMSAASGSQRWVVRYRGFVLIPQSDLTWVVRPERSPMRCLPFRAPASSVDDVKALIDWRLTAAA